MREIKFGDLEVGAEFWFTHESGLVSFQMEKLPSGKFFIPDYVWVKTTNNEAFLKRNPDNLDFIGNDEIVATEDEVPQSFLDPEAEFFGEET